MKTVFGLLAFFAPSLVLAAACCVGGSPKTFIELQRLENYEVGLATSVRDLYGNYNVYGEVDERNPAQSLGLTLGAGAHLTEDLQTFITVPWVYRVNRYGARFSRASLGDIAVGVNYVVLESLFLSDWYPTVALIGGLKAPTGAVDELGRYLPGTGNGYWEPFAGFSLRKALGPVNATVRFSYSYRWPQGGTTDGDNIELTESLAYPFHPRFSLAIGTSQSWTLAAQEKGIARPDSEARVISAFLSPTYFLTRFWSVTASADFTVPIDGFGVNEPTSRALTLTTRYGFY